MNQDHRRDPHTILASQGLTSLSSSDNVLFYIKASIAAASIFLVIQIVRWAFQVLDCVTLYKR